MLLNRSASPSSATSICVGRRRALRLGWPMKARHGPPHVGTMIWTNRAALGAGGRNGTIQSFSRETWSRTVSALKIGEI
jgi:hypothetical protein